MLNPILNPDRVHLYYRKVRRNSWRSSCPTFLTKVVVIVVGMMTGRAADSWFPYSWDLRAILKETKGTQKWNRKANKSHGRGRECQPLFVVGGKMTTPCWFFEPICSIPAADDLSNGHQYLLGETSGAITVTLTDWDRRNLMRGPIRTNGGNT